MAGAPVELIIFDCDGVLVDSEPLSLRILLETITEAGGRITAAEIQESFLGKSLATVSELLRRDHQVEMDAVLLERMRQRLYQAFREELQPISGIGTVLAALGQSFCVASSSQPERIDLALAVTGLADFFGKRIFSATMVAQGKPAPDLFLHAAAQMQTDPALCLVIEDSPAGIEAADRAGMRALGFTGGSHARSPAHRQQLLSLGPCGVFDDMIELPDLVRALEADRLAN